MRRSGPPLRGLRTNQQVAACARFRDRSTADVAERCTRAALRALARRIEHLNAEVDDHDRALKQLLDHAAPQLLAERGIGYVTAAAFYIACIPVAVTAKPRSPDSAERHRWKQPQGRTKPDIASTVAATAN